MTCAACGSRYPVIDGVPRFVPAASVPTSPTRYAWLAAFKDRLKSCPGLYATLMWVCSPLLFTGKSNHALRRRLPPGAVVLNLGSGPKRIGDNVINVDVMGFRGVDVVGDIGRLPVKDGSVDGVISEGTLEHIRDQGAAVREMERVLRKGGLAYVIVPFIVGYHPSPDDYHRWTAQGLAAELSAFDAIETGIYSGPTSALLWIFQEWLALALSFGIPVLHRALWLVLMVLTFPVKLLDALFSRYSMAANIAATFYYFGIKR